MPTAMTTYTTPEVRLHATARRSLCGASAAVMIAALLPAAADAEEVATNDDAELIRVCDRLTAIEAEITRLFDDEEMEEAVRDALLKPWADERDALTKQYWELPAPTSADGVRSIARTAWASAPRNSAGDITVAGIAEELAFHVIEYLAEGGAL
jgi:hypothetical protein